MNATLKEILLAGPVTVADIANEMNLPKAQVLRLLKEGQAEIHMRKNDDHQNEYWLPAPKDEDSFEASEEELAAQTTRQEIQESKAEEANSSSAETPAKAGANPGTKTCPLCEAEADQVQAGPEGSYLGAARTCQACKKTYNVFTNEEVKMAKDKTEGKRAAPLNPQYKINQRIAAAEQAGGKLVYQREGRTWLLTKKGVEPKTMTAQEFSNETAETIHKYLGFTPPAPAPKAEKPAKSATTKSSKTSKATGSGAAKKDLVGA